MNTALRLLFAISLTLIACTALAQGQDEDDLSLVYGDEDFVSIATGSRQPLSRAPAIASVITAENIKAMGATDLDQVFETVPGLHVSVSASAYNPIYVIRGIHSEFNPEVLMLINGIPITSLFHGDRGNIWGGMPVNDIARIEVIRGPGSAIYGADAFAGVINIVTKKKEDKEGIEIGVRAGTFGTQDAWVLHGGRWGGFDAAFSLEVHTTDGQGETIEADAQTFFDGIPPLTNASLAPGPVNVQRDTIDARLDLSHQHWRLRLSYQGRDNVGTGAGVAQALDPAGEGQSERILADLTYHDPDLGENWDLTTQLSYMNYNQQTELVLFPPGADFGFGVFPEGVIGNPDVYEHHYRFSISAFNTGLDKHRIRLGTGINYDDLYKVEENRNFTLNNPFGAPDPLGTFVTTPFLPEEDRTNYYAFIQDEWSFAPDWDLTAGLRYDHYSDFGSTTNPRLALVWQTRYNLTTKLLYGRAFRAPSFAEEFNINNPVALGNPDLDPETIDTVELAWSYQASTDFQTGLNLFYYKVRDIIRFASAPPPAPATSKTAQNTGDQTGYGLEWEAGWELTDTLRLSGNYAFQRSTDEETDSDAGNAPHHQLYARADWRFLPGWLLNTRANWVADRERVEGDTRDEIDDYTLVDVTLRYKRRGGRWEFAASARNVFDEEAREPSLFSETLGGAAIPNDLPLPGRNYYAEIRYQF